MAPDFPEPDLRDQAGRLRRLVISLFVAAVVGAITFGVARVVVQPASEPAAAHVNRNLSAGGFVMWVAAFVAAGAFVLALALQTWLAKRRDEATRVPPARLR
jgi:cytochrome c oxidase assembly factor CtaG